MSSGPLWKFFHKGLVKQNSAQWQAFCLGELTNMEDDVPDDGGVEIKSEKAYGE